MSGIWFLTTAANQQLGMSDIVRLQARYEGEPDEVKPGARWADGMPEIRENWVVGEQRNGWITLHQQRLQGIWRETGLTRKIRRNRRTALLIALNPESEFDAPRLPEWAKPTS